MRQEKLIVLCMVFMLHGMYGMHTKKSNVSVRELACNEQNIYAHISDREIAFINAATFDNNLTYSDDAPIAFFKPLRQSLLVVKGAMVHQHYFSKSWKKIVKTCSYKSEQPETAMITCVDATDDLVVAGFSTARLVTWHTKGNQLSLVHHAKKSAIAKVLIAHEKILYSDHSGNVYYYTVHNYNQELDSVRITNSNQLFSLRNECMFVADMAYDQDHNRVYALSNNGHIFWKNLGNDSASRMLLSQYGDTQIKRIYLKNGYILTHSEQDSCIGIIDTTTHTSVASIHLPYVMSAMVPTRNGIVIAPSSDDYHLASIAQLNGKPLWSELQKCRFKNMTTYTIDGFIMLSNKEQE